jgi:two-component system chemotaxis family response regulator WspR
VLQRSADVLARYGGEEFAVVLPGTSLEGAISIANQILEAVRRRALPHDGSEIGHVTVSIGAACVTPSGDMTVEDLTARADAALYAAKRSGRDRVHAAAPVGAGWVLHGHDTA